MSEKLSIELLELKFNYVKTVTILIVCKQISSHF